jgi:hypothetical protein
LSSPSTSPSDFSSPQSPSLSPSLRPQLNQLFTSRIDTSRVTDLVSPSESLSPSAPTASLLIILIFTSIVCVIISNNKTRVPTRYSVLFFPLQLVLSYGSSSF